MWRRWLKCFFFFLLRPKYGKCDRSSDLFCENVFILTYTKGTGKIILTQSHIQHTNGCNSWARVLSLAWSKLRLCSANHRAGYFSNMACDWLSRVWAYSEQETENGPWLGVSSGFARPITGQVTSVTCPVIGWAESELTQSKIQKTGPGDIW